MATTAAAVTDVAVDETGISFVADVDQPIDLFFGEQRIGSFWTVRDTTASAGARGRRSWAWPRSLRPHLDGSTELRLVVHSTGEQVAERQVTLGDGQGELTVVDARGNPLSLDKSQRLVRLFSSRSIEQLTPLLDSMSSVIAALQEGGIEPFVAYGTLLGAVREKTFIGHDSDADLGYVSRRDHPADVMIESFALQRRLTEQGFLVTRYSGAAFKVIVTEPDGTLRGLDVFAGFLREGELYLMGEVGTPYRPEWVFPLTEVELAGRTFPAPAVPERLLEAMYGPHWRVPDPAFKFETPRGVTRRLNGWFRGTRHRRESTWDPYWGQARALTKTTPSAFIRWVHQREAKDTAVIDVGCGYGSDVLFVARRGRRAYGLDYVPRSYAPMAARAEKMGFPATFLPTNLTELRSTYAATAEVRTLRGPKVMTARHLLDSTSTLGRRNLLRMARTVLADGGRLYVQALVAHDPAGDPPGLRPVDIDAFIADAERFGARVVLRREGRVDDVKLSSDNVSTRPGSPSRNPDDPEADPSAATPGGPVPETVQPAHLCRLVLQWN